MNQHLIEYLSQFVLPKRIEVLKHVLSNRTRYISVVLEDLYQGHNASAVLRSCECFGIQDVHIAENQNRFEVNEAIALGSYKWLTIKKYQEPGKSTLLAIESLRKQGYRIVATTPHTNDVTIDEFDLGKGKSALLFGSEVDGLSSYALDNADEFLKIPLYGFTESFNISVAAGIVLHTLTSRLRKSDIDWHLPTDEKDQLYLEWLKTTIRNSDQIVEYFQKRANGLL